MRARTVIVADEDAVSRHRVAAAFANAPDFKVVAEVCDRAGAMAKTIRLAPDVLLLDSALLRPHDAEAVGALPLDVPTKVIVLAACPDADGLIAAVIARADGYVEKGRRPERILAAVRSAFTGDPLIPRAIALEALRKLTCPAISLDAESVALRQLTSRQMQILHLLEEGRTNKEIADVLGLAEDTVANHVKSVFQKLAVHTRVEAAWLLRGASERHAQGRVPLALEVSSARSSMIVEESS